MLTNLINYRINAFVLNYKMSKVENVLLGNCEKYREKNVKKSKKSWDKFKIVVTLHKAGHKCFRSLKCQTIGVCFSQYMICAHIPCSLWSIYFNIKIKT